MGTCIISGGHVAAAYSPEAHGWTLADIRRQVRYPTSGNAGQVVIGQVLKHGEGISFVIDGKRKRGQIWSDAPYVGCVWAKVYEGDADFTGQIWLVKVDRKGRVTDWKGDYHADGTEHRVFPACRHRHCAESAIQREVIYA